MKNTLPLSYNWFSWPSVMGHTAGFVDPNRSWFFHLPCGWIVEVWLNSRDDCYTASLISPSPSHTPGLLYLDDETEIVDCITDLTNPSQLAASGWFDL